jgi:cellulose synthase (UDP-forming)
MNLAFLYESTLLPSFYAFYLGQMRRPTSIDVDVAESMNVVKKVAVMSLTVPGSESLEMVKQQMIAMTHIRYPHDSWILVDKHHAPEIEALARELGVLYFSRHDAATWGESKIKHWNQSDPPFKAKTKAGNVNSWIDAYGHHYSHFTQLDIDHKPIRFYLHKVLGFFLDTKVKWVQAPSVYGNIEHWAARGSAEQEFVLQGPLQMGFYGFCNTPFIIGSHCTYDMQAIREIGGFQPTRAEDHLDTVFLAARGYEGVFLPEVIAVGDGPETFETYLAQQFAWAYSMIQVLFTFTPKCMRNYTPRQVVQFLFVQTWYVLWSLSMFMLFILPVISLFLNVPIARVRYGAFLLHSLPMALTALMIWAWSHPWHVPEKLELSWRGILLHIARWPIVLSALVQVLFRVQKPYMITVKGLRRGKQRPFALQPHYPYLALIALSLGACWFSLLTFRHSSVQGYLIFALQGAAVLLFVSLTAFVKDIQDMMQDSIPFGSIVLIRAKPFMLFVLIVGIFIWTTCVSWNEIYSALVVYGNS